MNRLPKGLIVVLFGILTLAVLGCPRGASAVHRGSYGSHWSYGLDIDAGDYEYLSEYGEWIEIPQFGMVWHPFVVADWEPFFHGHWSWTNDGWAWISYEPFGWLVYHYGYWYREPQFGWFWVPGRIWSPARVEWYTYGDYCAWAPIPPPHYYWRDPWDDNDFNVWIVINFNNFNDEYVGHHRIHRPFFGEKIRRDAWIRRAPTVRLVENLTHRQIVPVKIPRERVDLRPNTMTPPLRYNRPKTIERTRMVLPEREINTVKQHSPQVEREVLVPRDKAPKREPQRAPEKPAQKKSQERQKKTIKRR